MPKFTIIIIFAALNKFLFIYKKIKFDEFKTNRKFK